MASRLIDRLRSLSPKSPRSSRASSKSPGPTRRDFHHKNRSGHCGGSLDCKATLMVDGSKFVVCKHQLAHAADYFRELFDNEEQQHGTLDSSRIRGAESSLRMSAFSADFEDEGVGTQTEHLGNNQYQIVVGKAKNSQNLPTKMQFQWFLESVIPNPVLREITDDILEPLMRLSQRFGAAGLRIRCTTYIRNMVGERAPMIVLMWLSWVLQFAYPMSALEACLPIVARLPLLTLEDNRTALGDRVFGDLVAAKLRASYDQAVSVYQQIHAADHFDVDLAECPRCHQKGVSSPNAAPSVSLAVPIGSPQDKASVRVHCSPCQRLLGCERCLRGKHCICDPTIEYEAVYHCKHGGRLLSDKSMDCHCQQYKLKIHENTCNGGIYSFQNGTVGLAPLARHDTA